MNDPGSATHQPVIVHERSLQHHQFYGGKVLIAYDCEDPNYWYDVYSRQPGKWVPKSTRINRAWRPGTVSTGEIAVGPHNSYPGGDRFTAAPINNWHATSSTPVCC